MDQGGFYDLLVRIPAFLLGIGLHEWAHAFVADRAGDPTPRRQGRLTLDLISHLDPIGTLCFFVAPIGWGKPVQVVPSNFARPDRDHMRVALAGPLTNLVLAAAGITLLGLYARAGHLGLRGTGADTTIIAVLSWVALLNVGLAIFNLVPIPPLDGARVARYWLGQNGGWIDQLQPIGIFLILALSQQGAFGTLMAQGEGALLGILGAAPWVQLLFTGLTVLAWLLNAELLGVGRPRPRPSRWD